MSLQLQYLREKIGTARTLLGVVETMHGLAAVNIRRAEAAAQQASQYARTVHLALHAALQAESGSSGEGTPRFVAREAGPRPGPPTFLLIATDMGLCGQFNERIVQYALALAERLGGGRDRMSPSARWIVVGLRGLERLQDGGAAIVDTLDAPGSVEAIPGAVTEAFLSLRPHVSKTDAGPLYVVSNRPGGGTHFVEGHLRLFPIDAARWRDLPPGESPWPAVPMAAPDPEAMLPHLIREQIYIDLFQAFVQSFAAENAARLASMKNATDNIDELLEDLQARYRRERQDAITTELMELLGGVEAVRAAEQRAQ